MESFVNWFIPPSIRGASPDVIRRARLLVVFCFAMALNTIPNVIVLLTGRVWTVGFAVLGAMFAYASIPFLLRAQGSLKLSGHALLFFGCINLIITSVMSGGLESPGMVWWGALLIFAVMLLGVRTGLFWTGVVIVECIVYLVLNKNGIALRNDVVRLDRAEALMSSYVTAFIAFFLLVRVYENLKTSMLSELESSKQIIEQAHQSARSVLDNVNQGLIIANASGKLSQERSCAVTNWFGPITVSDTLFSYFSRQDARFAAWLEVGWASVFEDILPLSLTLDQLPSKFTVHERHYSIAYRPIFVDTSLTSVLVVITDVTELVAAERAEADQRELLSVLQRVMSDRGIFVEFLEESRRRIRALTTTRLDRSTELRELHTLKGNTGLFGLISTSKLCHELEDCLVQEHRQLTDEEREKLAEHWEQIERRIMPIIGESTDAIQLSLFEYQEALNAVATGEPYPSLQTRIRGWAHEPTRKRLALFAEQITALSQKLGKGDVTVRIDDGGVRLPRECLTPFWSNFSHIVRNAVDHGLETPEERRKQSKPEFGQIELVTRIEHGQFMMQLADDGRGIDWSKVAERAAAKGLPAKTREDLESALFSDGLTTTDEATEISGRGVGLSAVKSVVVTYGGRISIESTVGHGTRFTFTMSLSRLRPSILPVATVTK